MRRSYGRRDMRATRIFRRRRGAAGALAAAVAALGAVGCGGSSSGSGGTSSSATGAATPPSGAINPAAAEAKTPGDIPDTQAYVTYAGRGFTVNVPEGWARSSQAGATTFTDKFNSVRVEARPAGS